MFSNPLAHADTLPSTADRWTTHVAGLLGTVDVAVKHHAIPDSSTMLASMDVASSPVIGHRLALRHLEYCAQHLASTGYAEDLILGGFCARPAYVAEGTQTLLLITGRHLVFLTQTKSDHSVRCTPILRTAIRVGKGVGSSSDTCVESPQPVTLALNVAGDHSEVDVFDVDLPMIRQLLATRSAPARVPSKMMSAVHCWRRTLASSRLTGLLGSRFAPHAAGAALILVVGGGITLQRFGDAESLRQSFLRYAEAVNEAKADEAWNYLTPYSRERLDWERWQAKFDIRTPISHEKIDDIRLDADRSTAKVIATFARPGAAPVRSVQTWKKLEGRWYRAYLEDIPDMHNAMPNDRRLSAANTDGRWFSGNAARP